MLATTLLLAIACDEPEEERAQGTIAPETSAPGNGNQAIRWLDVTMVLPEDGNVDAFPDLSGPLPGTQYVHVESEPDDELAAIVDGLTGEIVEDRRPSLSPKRVHAVDQALSSITVGPIDDSSAPWPYTGDTKELEISGWGSFEFAIPDPASGFWVIYSEADPGGSGIAITNGRSYAGTDLAGRLRIEDDKVLPKDSPALETFAGSIQNSGAE